MGETETKGCCSKIPEKKIPEDKTVSCLIDTVEHLLILGDLIQICFMLFDAFRCKCY